MSAVRDVIIGGMVLPLSERVCVMGVLNVTPDSFSDGGKFFGPDKAVERALELAGQGADIIDIGGESSRPGARSVAAEEELERVIPVIKALKGRIGVPISVDTCKAEVARQAVREGASIINDITALRGDPAMAEVAASSGAHVVLMHMLGTPGDMQDKPVYGDVVEDIFAFFVDAIEKASRAGIDSEKIIVDPGIGFGKTLEHNLKILKGLKRFRDLGRPLLAGTSRKSFIGALTGKEAGDRVLGTAASVAVAVINGADIVRVHDVGMMRDVVSVSDAVRRI